MQSPSDKNQPKHSQESAHSEDSESTPQPQPKKSRNEAKKQKIALMQHSHQQFNNFFENYLNRAIECPIGLEVMTDPVIVSSGYTYQRKNISDTIRVRGWLCPQTRQRLKQIDFIPNMAMRSLIDQYTKLVKKQQSVTGEQLIKKKKNSNRLSIEEYQKIYTRLQIDGNKRLLKHDFKKIVMKDFVRCNWNIIQQMDLSYCDIDDKGIQILLRKGKTHFRNVRELTVNANEIKNVKELERLPELRTLFIKNNDKLSEETKDYFKRINLMKGKLKIFY